MSNRTKWLSLLLSPLCVIMSLNCRAAFETDSVTLYTPVTKVAVSPGESIDYTIDVINNGKQIHNVDISLDGLPRSWNYGLKAGTYNIGELSILPGERKSFSLKVDVPLKVNKGSYRFKVLAGGIGSLPLVITVTEQGTFKTEFIPEQPNMQGHSNTTFTFNTNLKNRTSDKQTYALMAEVPRGWTVNFKFSYQPVTSVSVEANASVPVVVEIKAPEKIEAGTYKVPVSAANSATSATAVLEVVVTGSFGMELSTPTGLLSTLITAGESKRIELTVNNTGSTELNDIQFGFAAPANWDVTFDPKVINKLQPGKTEKVFATLKADKKAISGDYVTSMESKTPEVSSKISFRVSVETPMLYGWIGVLIIVVALGSVYYLFRKYGRR